jgi:hypothetical protein
MKVSEFADFFKDDPWAEISAPCYPEGRRLYRDDNRFWVSMNEKGQILFFIHEYGLKTVKALNNMAGIDVEICSMGASSSRLVCTLLETGDDIREKFSIVAKDIAFSCSQYAGVQLFTKSIEKIKSWADFLKPRRKGLTPSEFIGFLGELYTLANIFMDVHSPSESVRFWIGPEGKKQDFTMNSMAVEVKTTLSGAPNVVTISSLDQLDRITEKLYLLRLIFNISSDNSGFSLGSLYESCIKNTNEDLATKTLFIQKASRLYGKASEQQLRDCYSILSIGLFDVSAGFPSLTRSSVPDGIAGAKYEIYNSFLAKFEVNESIDQVIGNE